MPFPNNEPPKMQPAMQETRNMHFGYSGMARQVNEFNRQVDPNNLANVVMHDISHNAMDGLRND
eukprot:CAMPEP_0172384508 /NCGR_PEP_ID=MMETSP1061-20121228/2250_1 /TAXON_ID=37318 /ORGANISM="Pseudo-nitzschia pungens, Strain cf. pungens" /LENGTH=63 /DNA_ID=CAMNT_0013113143 /DNA_START=132 /DNA_END=320 /DNA_ORIENTATION=-